MDIDIAGDFSLDSCRSKLLGKTVYESKSLCIKELDDHIYIYFNDLLEKKCYWLRFDKNTVLEISNKIIAEYQ